VPVCTNDHLLIAFALDFKVLLVAFHRSYKGNGRAQFQIMLLLGCMKIVLTVSLLCSPEWNNLASYFKVIYRDRDCRGDLYSLFRLGLGTERTGYSMPNVMG